MVESIMVYLSLLFGSPYCLGSGGGRGTKPTQSALRIATRVSVGQAPAEKGKATLTWILSKKIPVNRPT